VDATTKAFAVELVKIAATGSQQEKRRFGYPAAVAASLPYAIGKGVADIPKGMIDKAVESKVRAPDVPVKWKEIVRRGVGRGSGFAAGAATAPLFFSGLKDIKGGKTKEERRKGYAKLITSGYLYGAGKGGIEAATEKGFRTPEGRRLIRKTMGSRGIVAAGAGALTAAAALKSLQKPKDKKERTFAGKYVMPATVGAVAGAGKGLFDEAWEKDLKLSKLKTPKGIRGLAAKASGRAAAGALGAVALRELLARFTPKKKRKGHWRQTKSGKRVWVKTASLIPPELSYPMYLGPRPGELYDQVHGWARNSDTRQLRRQYELSMQAGQGERTPSRRAVTYAMHDELARRGQPTRPLTMRDRVNRPDLVKNPTFVDSLAMMAAVAIPFAFLDGINKNMPLESRDFVLMDAMDRWRAQQGVERIQAGENFWGDPKFKAKPTDAYYHFGTMDDPGTKRVVKQLEREGTQEGKSLATAIRQGWVRSAVSLRPTSGPETYAHELGHATASAARRILSEDIARKAGLVGKVTAIAVPLLALEGSPDKSFATPEELESRAKFISAAGKVALALQAPVLAAEGLASLKGLGIMAAAGAGKGRLLQALVPLGAAIGTHAVPSAMPFVASWMLRRKAAKGRKRAAESGRR
jgi:hypothetical protein